jgi:hypothetical protein
LDEEMLTMLTPKFIDYWPNTYVFSKSMAEDYIRRKCANMPGK